MTTKRVDIHSPALREHMLSLIMGHEGVKGLLKFLSLYQRESAW